MGRLTGWITAVLIVLAADPNYVLNKRDDPYAEWAKALARAKKSLMWWKYRE